MKSSMGICVVLALVSIGITESSNCESYVDFPEYAKRQYDFKLPSGDDPLTDNRLDDSMEKWYGLPGQKVWNAPRELLYCGTHYPIWMKGEPPVTVGDVAEVQVCIADLDAGDDCFAGWNIEVEACTGFHVYRFLASSELNSAYCLGPSSNADDIPTVNVIPTVMQYLTHTRSKSFIYFQCELDKNEENDMFYQVTWYVNDARIYTTPIVRWSDNLYEELQLSETSLNGGGITSLGFHIHCSVTLRSNENGAPTTPYASEKKFMGIRIIQDVGQVTVKSGESTSIRFESTVDIACGDELIEDQNCVFEIAITNSDDIKDESNPLCVPQVMASKNCGTQFKKLSQYETKEITVTGEILDNFGEVRATTKFEMRTGSVRHMPILSDYVIGTITVEVVKEQSIADGKICYAVVDPHMLTFDGRPYEHQCGGYFTMYKHTDLPMEVQIRTKLCNSNYAYCVCAFAVRSSRTVFRVDHCSPTNRRRYYYASCETDRSLMRVQKYGQRYKIFLPTGTIVEAYISYPDFLNVYIYPTAMDESKTVGLCGTLNGNGNDDFLLRNGDPVHVNNYGCNRDFSASWRVDDDENLFHDDVISGLSEWDNTNHIYCTCSTTGQGLSPNIACSTTNAKNCEYDPKFNDLTDIKQCVVSKKRRKRRQATGFKCTAVCGGNTRRKRDSESTVFQNGWTEETAKEHCSKLLDSSSTVQLCEDLNVSGANLSANIDICVLDIKLTGSTNFSMSALEMYKDECKRNVQLNSTYQTTTEGETSIADRILASACPNECSFNGLCEEGTCSCNEHFESPDCSIDVRLAPTAYGLEDDGHCDLDKDSCQEVSVFLDYVVDTAYVSCRLYGFVITSEGDIKELDQTKVKPDVPFYGEAVCPLPTSPGLFDDDLAYGYRVSASNNGQSFSEEYHLMIYDNKCIQCTIGDVIECKLKKSACLINGRCFGEGEENPTDECLVCRTSGNSAGTWERSTDPACPRPSSSPTMPAPDKMLCLSVILASVFYF